MMVNRFCLFLLGASAFAQTVQHADKFPGADAGEKIAMCMAALPPQGGICDARELSGQQKSALGFTVGGADKPVQLMLGPVTLAIRETIHVQARSSITGMPSGTGIGSTRSPSTIQAADGTTLSAVVQMDGVMSLLQDVTVDGNKKAAPQGGVGILVNQAWRAEMFRVTAQNAPKYGIEIYSKNNESCCAKLSKVMAIGNGQAGLHVANTADVFVSVSEFEDNGAFGIELNNSPTTRIEHSDMGGNLQDGVIMYGAGSSPLQSHKQIIVGNQFGNNGRYDINVAGWDPAAKKHVSTGNLISSNGFIGSSRRPAGYAAIQIVDSGENTIVGNNFSATSAHPYSACVNITGEREGADLVTGNTCSPSATSGKAGFNGTANTQFGDNRGKTVPAPLPTPK
jgi:Right handed beta helix region